MISHLSQWLTRRWVIVATFGTHSNIEACLLSALFGQPCAHLSAVWPGEHEMLNCWTAVLTSRHVLEIVCAVATSRPRDRVHPHTTSLCTTSLCILVPWTSRMMITAWRRRTNVSCCCWCLCCLCCWCCCWCFWCCCWCCWCRCWCCWCCWWCFWCCCWCFWCCCWCCWCCWCRCCCCWCCWF